MNSKQLNLFKILLFVFGFVVIGAAYFIVNDAAQDIALSAGQKFFWVNLFILYSVFFCPFFFSSLKTANIDTKITSTVGIWIAVLIFEVVMIVLSVLVLKNVLDFKPVLIMELVLIFICGIFIYFAYFSGNHIQKVQNEEPTCLSHLEEVKSTFDSLLLKAELWPENLTECKSLLKKICEDVHYLSPVNNSTAESLEKKLVACACVIGESATNVTELDSKIKELSILLRQRKSLIN